ncbi:MAG: hypothetical protein EOP49_07380 [Sphingobacteriales bacterium]|nr:MAG: hypothetical protein EOP49_07380 [Sphingobacteriales bacterium]
MKWILALVAVVFFSASASAQQYKFLATGLSVMERDANGEWGKWSELVPTKITVVLDTSKDRIIIYSQEIQIYAILNYEKERETDDDLTYSFSCSDDDGMPFTVSIITRKKQDNRKQMYINQKNIVIVYNIMNYPDNNIEIK